MSATKNETLSNIKYDRNAEYDKHMIYDNVITMFCDLNKKGGLYQFELYLNDAINDDRECLTTIIDNSLEQAIRQENVKALKLILGFYKFIESVKKEDVKRYIRISWGKNSEIFKILLNNEAFLKELTVHDFAELLENLAACYGSQPQKISLLLDMFIDEQVTSKLKTKSSNLPKVICQICKAYKVPVPVAVAASTFEIINSDESDDDSSNDDGFVNVNYDPSTIDRRDGFVSVCINNTILFGFTQDKTASSANNGNAKTYDFESAI